MAVDVSPRSPFERHVQTIMNGAVLLLVVWVVSKVHDLTVTAATQTVEIKALRSQVADAADDRYRARDASRDFLIRDKAIVALDTRLSFIERTILSAPDNGE